MPRSGGVGKEGRGISFEQRRGLRTPTPGLRRASGHRLAGPGCIDRLKRLLCPNAGFTAPNIDITAWFHPFDPRTEWLLTDHQCDVVAGGLMGAHARLWSEAANSSRCARRAVDARP
ncbi:MAG TPA: hypothetical protein EYQ60_18190 [Myxococcales bacterium]|nr:hypothetical protein [Myxococcales bacterium]